MKHLLISTLLMLANLSTASTALASDSGGACSNIFSVQGSPHLHEGRIKESSLSADWHQRRVAVEDFLRAHPEIPAYLKNTASGPVPVVLLNPETYPALRPLLHESVSYGFEHRPEHVDHGLMRVEDTMIDFGHMNTRRGPPNTELHLTGIAWKNLNEVLPWNRVVVQMSYLMPREDRDNVRYYQTIRRASLLRTRFFFSEDQFLDRVTPNLFENVIEDCFDYCKSDKIHQLLSEVERQVSRLSRRPIPELFSLPEVREFQARARHHFLTANAFDQHQINWFTLQPMADQTGLRNVLPGDLSNRDREALVNLIASHDAIFQYERILQRYEITPDDGYADLHRRPVSFVVVMDRQERADEFRSSRYEAFGKWFHWRNEDQVPFR